MKTFNLAITSNIINETLTLPKNKAKPVCSNKDCAANSLFGQKKYNYLLDDDDDDDDDDNKKATPSSSPTNASNTMQCCCSALAPIENKTQIKMNRRNSPAKTPNKIGKDKKSITTENIVGLAMTKCSLETLENSISLKSELDTNAQVTLHTQSPSTSKQHDKSLTKGNHHLMKKTLVVEKLKSTNSVIARKLFSSTKRAIAPHSNNSIDKHKETPKTPDSTDLDDDDTTTTTTTTNTNTTTTTATVTTSHKDNDNDNDKVKEEESQSMITSLLRTTTL